MLYLIQSLFFPWLALALLVGVATGWWACRQTPPQEGTGWLGAGVAAFVFALFTAAMLIVPGRLGLWFDSALAMLAFWLIGCCLGCLLGRAGAAEPRTAATKPNEAATIEAAEAPPAAFTVAALDTDAPPAAVMPPVEGEDAIPGQRPPGLAAPRGGVADDLKRIRGIGRQNEGRLHGLGIWHFDQIAGWTAPEALWVGGYLAFPGRIEREEWVAQAKALAAGRETAFSQRVAKGEVATSADDGSKGEANVVSVKPPRRSSGSAPQKATKLRK